MVLLNSEKQCIHMYRGRKRRASAAVAEVEEEGEEGGAVVAEEEEVSLGVIMTNTEIFHIYHIISLFNLPFSIFSISFHNFLLYFPYLFTFQPTFFPYFPYHFTFHPYFLYHFTIFFCIFQIF
jgi:predicted TIM-barrel fold metal-dependent hydrolase